MTNNIEYLAVTQAHNRANREANRIGAEAARDAYTAAYEWDDSTYDPEGRDRALTKAENAAEAARERAFSQAWQPLYDTYLAEEFAKLTPARPSAATVPAGEARYRDGAGELTQRSARRF